MMKMEIGILKLFLECFLLPSPKDKLLSKVYMLVAPRLALWLYFTNHSCTVLWLLELNALKHGGQMVTAKWQKTVRSRVEVSITGVRLVSYWKLVSDLYLTGMTWTNMVLFCTGTRCPAWFWHSKIEVIPCVDMVRHGSHIGCMNTGNLVPFWYIWYGWYSPVCTST